MGEISRGKRVRGEVKREGVDLLTTETECIKDRSRQIDRIKMRESN